MHENPDMHVSSAKQLMELNQKREKEAQRIKAAENLATQLASEQVALLRESNELSRKALDEARDESVRADVIDIKPNFFGLGANLNEAWRRIKKRSK